MIVGLYDPIKTNVVIDTFRIGGWFSGSHIAATRTNPKSIVPTVGSLGEVALSINPNRTGTIHLVLLQQSSSNADLSALEAAKSIFPIFIQNIGTVISELCTASEAWIEEIPGNEYEAETGSRNWVIGCADLQIIRSTN